MSERYGRRPVYVYTTIIFVVSSIGIARADTIGAVIGLRFLQAVGSSTAQSWHALGCLLPQPARSGFRSILHIPQPWSASSPIFGGLLVQWRGWRAIAWFLAIYGVAMWLMILVFLPETSVGLKARQAAMHILPSPTTDSEPRRKKWHKLLAEETFNHCLLPLQSLKYLAFPPIGLTTLYISICFSCTFAYSTDLPYEFAVPPYNFSQVSIGLVFIAGCLGGILGSLTSGKLSDMVVIRAKQKMGDAYRPEVRLRVSWLGVPFVPIELLIYGWTIQTGQFWIVPLVGIFFFALGMQLTNSPIIAYYSEAVPGKAASVVAVHNLCRMFSGVVVAAVVPSATGSIGTGWFMTILACLTAVGALALEAVRRWGGKWRKEREEREREREENEPSVSTPPLRGEKTR
ncbi:MFS general substrate transporter [Dacryopinax primogenitus]|uniref:MFS general substrate transporter n=1 Tax=Dacryopinax primogenitus (strain DJM 731) TaxID=1858805 RepID=M5FYC8_DACPD|nr:MFS general substrate transporter [Dacryopinax primogenitus]EJU00840.1 MFS general substrate transporter [Dacryopinax primogenitus]